MKKLFQIIGILSLMGFSFFYTDKTISVVKEYDLNGHKTYIEVEKN